MDQMTARGRQVTVSIPGEGNGASKLTDPDVIDIRKRYATGRVTQKALAEEYAVTQQLISLIVNRKMWKHLPNEQKEMT